MYLCPPPKHSMRERFIVYLTHLLVLGFTFVSLKSYSQCSADAGSNQTICAGQTIQLGGTPVAVNSTGAITYSWSNITGPNSTVANPSVSPTSTTTYTVSLSGGNCNGETDQVTISVVPAPNANFTASPQNQCASTPVTFTNTTTGCTNCTYTWDFGDPASGASNTSSAFSPQHTFQAIGTGTQTFTVTLTVTGPAPNNCQDTQTLNVTVNRVPDPVLTDPINNFAQCSGDATFPVTVFDASTPGTNTSYSINWGDGSPVWSGSSAPQGLLHTYNGIDVYDLVYTITGSNGCTASETFFVSNITNPAVGAGINGGTQGCAPLDACFNLLNFQGNHESTVYNIDFGDGSPVLTYNHNSLPLQVCHSYTGSSCAQGGAYTFTITATNNCDNSVATITPVRVYTGPQASFSATPVPACVNAPISFINNSVLGFNNSCSQSAIFTWSWGDGSPNTVVTSTATQSHSYSAPGNYTVTLSAQNFCGTTTFTQVVCVETPPTPVFTVNANTGCLPFNVNTTNTSNNGVPCNVNYTWIVDYTDLPCDPDNGSFTYTGGTSASSLNPQFQFTSVGTYNIRLRMTNACGIFEDNELITVNTVPVVVVNPISTLCSGNTVTPSALVDNCNLPITSYAWSAPGGTGGNLTALNPGAITYANPGNYNISLTATNACGPSVGSNTVNVLAPPNVSIVTSTGSTSICQNSSVVLTASGAGSYSWTPSGTLSSSIGSSVTASPGSTITYTVTGTAGTCVDTETITITVNTLPSITASGVFSMCVGETEQLGVNVTGGAAPYNNYVWNNASTLNNPNIANPISSAVVTTNYSVQVTDNNGCVGIGTVPVTVNPLPVVNAGPDIQVCDQPVPTNMTGFSPTTGGTGVWSGTGVTPAGVFTPNGVGCVNLTYTFTTTATGCVNSDVVQVCTIAPQTANGGPDFSVCNDPVPVPLPAGGTWSGTNVNANAFTPSTVGTFNLTFTVGTGSCQANDVVAVTVLPNPTANAGVDISGLCANGSVTLNGTGTSPNGAITLVTWSGACGGITNGTTFTPTVSPVGASCAYNMTIVDAAGCDAQDQVNITINPLPVVNAGLDITLCNQPIANTLVGFTPAGGTWTATPGIGLTGSSVTPQGTGTFTLTYTYTNPLTGCTNSDQVLVNVINPTTANAGPDVELCLNSPLYQIVPPIPGGTWSPNPTVTTAGSFNPTTAGTYNLTYSIGTGTCLTTDQMTITVNSLPTIELGPNQSICLNDPIQLNGVISGGEGPFNVSWNFPATLSNPNIANPIANPTVTTNYTVTLVDNNLCQDTDNILITVNTLPIVEAGNNLVLCDQPITETLTGFSPTAGGVGTWTGPGIINANGQFQSPGVGNYWVYYEFTAGGNACSNIDSIQITVNPPVIANAGPDQTFCLNEPLYTFTGINPTTGGTWTGTGITSATLGQFNPSIAGVGTHTVTLTFGAGTCLSTDQTVVNVLPLPNVVAGANNTVCGNLAPFNMTGFIPATGGVWEGTGITNSTLGTFDPAVGAGTYNIFYRYIDPLSGCSDTSFKVVTVSPVPVANFTLAPLGCTNANVAINNISTGATTYSWNFGNGTILYGFEPGYTYADEGFFDITLIASNAFGCNDTLTRNNEIIDPPTAALNLLPAEGCAPLLVAFENNSIGQYVTYLWDLSVSTSTDQVPTSIIYQQGPDVAFYPISLTVTNFCGVSVANDEVIVNPQPVASFGTNMDVFCSPFTVLFNNTSVGNPDTFEWDFGDGSPNVFVEEPISHVFFADTIPVDYTILLYLENECGLDTTQYTITVLPNTVTAFFNTNITQGCSPLTVEFTDFSEGGDQISYNFGDGGFTGNANPIHTFNDAGTFTVYQYVDNGCSYDTTQIDVIVFPSPTVDFTVDDPSVCVNEGIQFTPEVTDVVSITWDFGDGFTSQLSNPVHFFTAGNTYSVTMTGVSDNFCTTSTTQSITVFPQPVADFSIPDLIGCSPFNACFSNSSSGAQFYTWDFGNGNTSNLANPCFEYTNTSAAPELYTVRLISESFQLCTDTLSIDIIVSPQPLAAFALSSYESCSAPVIVSTSNASSFANGYQWLLDGNPLSTSTNTSFELAEVGSYLTTLVASNQFGCTSESDVEYNIYPVPSISFASPDANGCVSLQVQFNNTSTGAATYVWDFGDGVTQTGQQVGHTYSEPGSYDVSVTGTSVNGCSSSLTLENYVNAYAIPVASIYLEPANTDIYSPTIVFFSSGTEAETYRWSFGDGNFAFEPYVEHTYEEGGVFPISLTVESGEGCRSEAFSLVTIEDIFNIYVPNAFTPDDDGINEYFLPQLTGKVFIERYTFRVFDRWGTVLFETNDPETPWLGDVRGGEYYAKDDVYNWQVVVQLKGVDDERIYSGHVYMVR